MGLRDRLARTFSRKRAIAEAVEKKLREAHVGVIDTDEAEWRSLTGSKRDLPSITHDFAIEVAFTLYQQNPLAHRALELMRDYVVGDGITFSAQNPEVAEVLEDFWDDDVNRVPARIFDWALELGLFGEWVPEAFVGGVSGVVRLGHIDPSQIKGVDPVEGNPLVADVVRVKKRGFGIKGKPLKIIRDRGNGVLEGDVFYFRINAVSNATRGWPDLLHVADWLDNYDRLLWDMAERAALIRSFIWDVTLKGADQVQIDAWLRKNRTAPKAGSVRAHNESEEWRPEAPELGSSETAQEAEVLLEHIAGGMGLPKHWLSSAEDVNRATALEMGAPTVRRLAARQQYFLRCLSQIVRYVLEQAQAAGRIKTTEGLVEVFEDGEPVLEPDGSPKLVLPWQAVQLQAPEISPKDVAAAGQLFVNVANALSVAKVEGWLNDQAAREVLAVVLSQLGFEFDPRMAEPEEEEGEEEPEAPPVPDLSDLEEPASKGAMEEAVRRVTRPRR